MPPSHPLSAGGWPALGRNAATRGNRALHFCFGITCHTGLQEWRNFAVLRGSQEAEQHHNKGFLPFAQVDDLMDFLFDACWFSTLDLHSGYWQVEVDTDQEKTTFTMQQGLFQFRVMPFGLCNAPSIFRGSWSWS